jgi:hypothetical protein
MSSAVLYLAIVALWGAVLVPMWLRRDGEGIGRLLHRRAEPLGDGVADDRAVHDEVLEDRVVLEDSVAVEEPRAYDDPAARRRRATRGAVIARRRRRTLGLSLLTLTAVITVATRLTPWWFVMPPIALLGGHLSLLRVAVRMDAVRRRELRRAAAIRAARAQLERDEQQAREAEEATRTAEVIELPERREEVYDQYTDLRAVGD